MIRYIVFVCFFLGFLVGVVRSNIEGKCFFYEIMGGMIQIDVKIEIERDDGLEVCLNKGQFLF